jgi:hypothetical protein
MTMTSHGNSHDWKVGSSGVGCVSTATHGNRRLARPPTDHFKRLLEETFPNHIYLVRHKLKDCGMMQSFMTSGVIPSFMTQTEYS